MSSWQIPVSSQEAFEEIWKIHPELQNHMSSAWWFFLLLPKQEEGYGPRQMMFSYASRAGHLIGVKGKWQRGFDVEQLSEGNGVPTEFMTTVVGWINDGDTVHEEIVHQGALAKLSKEGYLRAFNQINGKELGAEIKRSENHEMGIKANFDGENGFAKFEVWSDPEDEEHAPQLSDIQIPFVRRFFNVNLVAWRRLNFKGMFKSPAGVEELEGIGYFQRVLFNGPLIPWIWVWVVFENESVFSTFIPYAGLHNFRQEDKHFSNWAENRLMKIAPSAYFIDEGKSDEKETEFTNIDLKIENDGKPFHESLPKVKLRVSNDNGDFLNIVVQAHGHAQFHLERAVIKQFWKSRWNYNEYMVKIPYIEGKVKGKTITTNMEEMGKGWGNMEYAFGMSL